MNSERCASERTEVTEVLPLWLTSTEVNMTARQPQLQIQGAKPVNVPSPIGVGLLAREHCTVAWHVQSNPWGIVPLRCKFDAVDGTAH